MKRFFRFTASLLAAAVLAACANLAPEVQRPAPPVPDAWPSGPSYAASSAQGTAVADLAWQDFIADARLRELITQALAQNRDLRVAALQIERARALYQIQRADRFPTVDASASLSAQRVPAGLSPTGQATTQRQYEAGIGFSRYELDLFGRVRNLNEQALQAFFSTAEARRSVHISLIAEVAHAYLTLAADRERLQLARRTFDVQHGAFTLIQRRFEFGAASQLDLRRAQTTVDTARADVARFTTVVAQDENALALLVGAPLRAEWLPEGLSPVASLAEVPIGVPSQVLARRPDIRQAEHRLQAAHASIGAARAAFFPSVTLTAAGGVASNTLSDLFRRRAQPRHLAGHRDRARYHAGRVRARDPGRISRSGRRAGRARHARRAAQRAAVARRSCGRQPSAVGHPLPPGCRELPRGARCAALVVCGAARPDHGAAIAPGQSGHAVQGVGRRVERASDCG
jgi:outer membrane protein, multidrug efflux system